MTAKPVWYEVCLNRFEDGLTRAMEEFPAINSLKDFLTALLQSALDEAVRQAMGECAEDEKGDFFRRCPKIGLHFLQSFAPHSSCTEICMHPEQSDKSQSHFDTASMSESATAADDKAGPLFHSTLSMSCNHSQLAAVSQNSSVELFDNSACSPISLVEVDMKLSSENLELMRRPASRRESNTIEPKIKSENQRKSSRSARRVRIRKKELPVSCAVCDKVFNTKWGLKEHMLIVHKPGSKEKCPICGWSFLRGPSLARHLKAHEDGRANTSQCPHCGKLFANANTLKQHTLRVHSTTGEGKMICELCGKEIMSSRRKWHMDTAHPNPQARFECDACQKVFSSITQLSEHKRTHNIKFSCRFCEYASCKKSVLDAHVARRHTKSERFSCSECDRVYYDKDSLRKHRRKHLPMKATIFSQS